MSVVNNNFETFQKHIRDGDLNAAKAIVYQTDNGLSQEQQTMALSIIRDENFKQVFETSDIFIKLLGKYFSIREICKLAPVCKFFNSIKIRAVFARISSAGLSFENKHTYQKIFKVSSDLTPVPPAIQSAAAVPFYRDGSDYFDFYSVLGAQTSIEELDLSRDDSFCDKTDANIQKIISGLKHPEDLKKIDLNYTQITNDTIKFLREKCPNLEELNLSSCDKITNEAVTELPKGLKSLNLADNCGIQDSGIGKLAENCPQLTELNLSSYGRSISDDDLMALPQGLKKINLNHLAITDSHIEKLVTRCPHLTEINLDQCYNITDKAILAIAQGCRDLISITFSGPNFGNESIKVLAQNAYNLKNLKICGKFTDEAFAGCQNWHKLESIDIEIYSFDYSITNEAIDNLSANCPALKNFTIRNYKNITDGALSSLLLNCPLLQRLTLNRCGITNDGIRFIAAQNLPYLKVLELTGLEITKISSLIQKGASLTSLTLYAPKVSNEEIIELALNCPNLKLLQLCDCRQVSRKEAVEVIRKNRPDLKLETH